VPHAAHRQLEVPSAEALARIEIQIVGDTILFDLQHVARFERDAAGDVEPHPGQIDCVSRNETANRVRRHAITSSAVDTQPTNDAPERDRPADDAANAELRTAAADQQSDGGAPGGDELAAPAVDGRAAVDTAGLDALVATAVELGAARGAAPGNEQAVLVGAETDDVIHDGVQRHAAGPNRQPAGITECRTGSHAAGQHLRRTQGDAGTADRIGDGRPAGEDEDLAGAADRIGDGRPAGEDEDLAAVEDIRVVRRAPDEMFMTPTTPIELPVTVAPRSVPNTVSLPPKRI